MLSNSKFIVNADAAGKNPGLLTAINSGKTANLKKSMSSAISDVANYGGRTVNVNVQSGKERRALAQLIADQVTGALAKPPDRFRYGGAQKAAMAWKTIQYAQKSHS